MQLQLDSVRYRLGVDAHEVHLILPSPVCVSSALEVVLGVNAAFELASSGVNERVTCWDASTVEADAAAGGAGDTVFVDLAGGLGPSTAL